MRPLYFYFVISASLCSILCILVLMIICYDLLLSKQASGNKTKTSVKCLSICSCLSFTLSAICASIVSGINQNNNPLTLPIEHPQKQIAISLTLLDLTAWSLGVVFLYILFILRIKIVYKDTTFQISKKTLYHILHCINFVIIN
eukprot:107383_1